MKTAEWICKNCLDFENENRNSFRFWLADVLVDVARFASATHAICGEFGLVGLLHEPLLNEFLHGAPYRYL